MTLACLGHSTAVSAATTIYNDFTAFELATGAGLGGQLRARPTRAGTTLTYNFTSPITAFGGDFDLSPGGDGNGLRFVLDGSEIVSEEIGAPYVGFWGFVSDVSFTTLVVQAGSDPGIAETHLFDNLSFGVASPAPIPLPAGFPLLLTALLGFFGMRHVGRRA